MARRRGLTDREIRAAMEADDDEDNSQFEQYEEAENSDDDDADAVADLPVECVIEEADSLSSGEDGEGEALEEHVSDENIGDEIIEGDGIWKTKDGYWRKEPFEQGRAQAHNIIRGPLNRPVVRANEHIETPEDALFLLFDTEVIDLVMVFTNLYGKRHIKVWKDIDTVEMKSFIGLLFLSGLNKQGISDYRDFWDPMFGIPLFSATMCKTRFQEIMRCLRFDDKRNRNIGDKFAPIRTLWEKVMSNLQNRYIPGENLTIDEQLVPYRGRVSFRQYMPSKPDKYGMKVWWICDSKNAYPLLGIPYLGKEGGARATNLGKTVVLDLVKKYEQTGRNITMDNFFSSKELCEELLQKGLTMVGTMRKNKRCIPQEFQKDKSRPEFSSLFGFTKKMTLVSYVPKKLKSVVLLSSMHHTTNTEPTQNSKPEIILYYNSTKGAVDTLDQMCHYYSTKRKTRRWPLAMFQNIVDVVGVAAKIIFEEKNVNWRQQNSTNRRFNFLKELVLDLINPQIKRRSEEVLHRRSTALAISTVLPSTTSAASNKRKRCHICPYAKGRMSQQICNNCQNNVCTEHSVKNVICNTCNNNK